MRNQSYSIQLFEKMISGKYLGEIFRQVLVDAISKGVILGGVVCALILGSLLIFQQKSEAISKIESVTTADISNIERFPIETRGLRLMSAATSCPTTRRPTPSSSAWATAPSQPRTHMRSVQFDICKFWLQPFISFAAG